MTDRLQSIVTVCFSLLEEAFHVPKLVLCLMCVFVCMCKCTWVFVKSISLSRYKLAPSVQEEEWLGRCRWRRWHKEGVDSFSKLKEQNLLALCGLENCLYSAFMTKEAWLNSTFQILISCLPRLERCPLNYLCPIHFLRIHIKFIFDLIWW